MRWIHGGNIEMTGMTSTETCISNKLEEGRGGGLLLYLNNASAQARVRPPTRSPSFRFLVTTKTTPPRFSPPTNFWLLDREDLRRSFLSTGRPLLQSILTLL